MLPANPPAAAVPLKAPSSTSRIASGIAPAWVTSTAAPPPRYTRAMKGTRISANAAIRLMPPRITAPEITTSTMPTTGGAKPKS